MAQPLIQPKLGRLILANLKSDRLVYRVWLRRSRTLSSNPPNRS